VTVFRETNIRRKYRSWHEHQGPLATIQCTRRLHSLTQSVAVQGERNWATALSGSHLADYRPSQLQLRNRISPRRPPVEGGQPCTTNADNAIVQFIECMPLRNYDRSNRECQKTECEFEFINRTSNFRTSFNNPIYNCTVYNCVLVHGAPSVIPVTPYKVFFSCILLFVLVV